MLPSCGNYMKLHPGSWDAWDGSELWSVSVLFYRFLKWYVMMFDDILKNTLKKKRHKKIKTSTCLIFVISWNLSYLMMFWIVHVEKMDYILSVYHLSMIFLKYVELSFPPVHRELPDVFSILSFPWSREANPWRNMKRQADWIKLAGYVTGWWF